MGNGPYFASRKSSGGPQMDKVRTHHGTADPQAGQGTRSPKNAGSKTLNGPGSGGAAGSATASLKGQGTMEQK